MIAFKALLFFVIICAVKSDKEFENQCKNVYTDLNNTEIDVFNYCSNNLCIKKCCGENEILRVSGLECRNKKKVLDHFKILDQEKVNYSNILSSRNGENTSKQNFVFIRNRKNLSKCTVNINYDEYKILQIMEYQYCTKVFHQGVFGYLISVGRLRVWCCSNKCDWKQNGEIMQRNGSEWRNLKTDYCIDFQPICNDIVYKNNTPFCAKYKIKIAIRAYIQDTHDAKDIRVFELVALPISSFFLLLVFVVYCLLPELQNLIGRVFMAYTVTMLTTFLLKWLINFYINNTPQNFCKIISPCMYFAALSCFFWFNVISYDVWWGLRSHRKLREINRRGENVKFIWYCLYAWGSPLLLTIIVTLLDIFPNENILKPPFKDCLHVGDSFDMYFKIPIGILIFINTVLFTLTVYNICMIKRAVSLYPDATSNKKQKLRLFTYFKLFAIMGINWCLELLPSDLRMPVYILTSSYNIFSGIAIFFLFVFKKKIFISLCRKFKIFEDFTKKLELSKRSRGEATSTTNISRGSSSKKSSHSTKRKLESLQNK